jgi:hypothetical protein
MKVLTSWFNWLRSCFAIEPAGSPTPPGTAGYFFALLFVRLESPDFETLMAVGLRPV